MRSFLRSKRQVRRVFTQQLRQLTCAVEPMERRVLMSAVSLAGHAATITLAAACDTAGAREIPSDQPGMRRFERPLSLEPQFSDQRFYTFPGGCVTYQFRFPPGVSPVLAGAADTAVSFVPRSSLVRHVRETEGLALCGRGAPCPG